MLGGSTRQRPHSLVDSDATTPLLGHSEDPHDTTMPVSSDVGGASTAAHSDVRSTLLLDESRELTESELRGLGIRRGGDSPSDSVLLGDIDDAIASRRGGGGGSGGLPQSLRRRGSGGTGLAKGGGGGSASSADGVGVSGAAAAAPAAAGLNPLLRSDAPSVGGGGGGSGGSGGAGGASAHKGPEQAEQSLLNDLNASRDASTSALNVAANASGETGGAKSAAGGSGGGGGGAVGAAGGAKRAESKGKKKVEITVGDLVKYLTKDVSKKRQTNSVRFYFLFLVTFTAVLALERLGNQERTFFRDISIRRQLNAVGPNFMNTEADPSTFHSINSYESLWGWLIPAIESIWPVGTLKEPIGGPGNPDMTWTGPSTLAADPERVNIPLGLILLRQFRVRPEPCDFGAQLQALPSDLQASLALNASSCFPVYSDQVISTDSYSHNGQEFVCNNNQTKGRYLNSIRRSGAVHSYNEPSKAFSEILYTEESFERSIHPRLTDLQKNKWVDEATRAVLVEMVTYNQADGNFVFTSLLIERLATNNYIPSLKSIPFDFLVLWNAQNHAILALDIFVIVFILYDFCDYVYTLKAERDIHYEGGIFSGINVWGFFRLLMVGTFIAAYYYRALLWEMSWGIGSDFFQENEKLIWQDFTPSFDKSTAEEKRIGATLWMWSNFANYAYLYTQWSVLVAGCIVLSYLRVFSFLQFYELLNILTETIKLAVGELLGVMLLGAIVVLGYSITGHMLYGGDIEDFRHLRHAIGALLRTMVSGEVPQYDDMLKLHRWETQFFVLTYQILVWLILLNMILAIISGAFASVQEGMQGQGSFNPFKMLRKWVVKKVQYLKACNKRSVRSSSGGGGGGGSGGGLGSGPRSGQPGSGYTTDDGETTSVGYTDGGAASGGRTGTGGRRVAHDNHNYISTRIRAVQALRRTEEAGEFREAGRGEGEGGTYITTDDFYNQVCEQRNVTLSLNAVNRIFDKASKELSASNRSVSRGEKWAQGITQSLRKVGESVGAIQRIQETTSMIPAALKVEGEMHNRMVETFARLEECKETITQLKALLEKAQTSSTPLPELSQKMKELRDAMNTAAPVIEDATVKLQRQTEALRPSLLRIENTLNKWTKRLLVDIQRGTLWGPPTAAAATRSVPRMAASEKGVGVVASVKKFAFPTHYPSAGDDPNEDSDLQEKTVHFGGEDEVDVQKEAGLMGSQDPIAIMKQTQAPRGILKSRSGLGASINMNDL